jgi:hypothetical protein
VHFSIADPGAVLGCAHHPFEQTAAKHLTSTPETAEEVLLDPPR